MEVQPSEQAGLVRELRDEILRLKKQPKSPNLKPGGSGSAARAVRDRRVEATLDRVWKLQRSLGRYRNKPKARHRSIIEQRFDRMVGTKTDCASLDRLQGNRAELLRVLDRPETPLHTNRIESDIRSHVTRRKISYRTRSDVGRAAWDACLGALKTCDKLSVSFWDYLCNRLGVADAKTVPQLAGLIRRKATA